MSNSNAAGKDICESYEIMEKTEAASASDMLGLTNHRTDGS